MKRIKGELKVVRSGFRRPVCVHLRTIRRLSLSSRIPERSQRPGGWGGVRDTPVRARPGRGLADETPATRRAGKTGPAQTARGRELLDAAAAAAGLGAGPAAAPAAGAGDAAVFLLRVHVGLGLGVDAD